MSQSLVDIVRQFHKDRPDTSLNSFPIHHSSLQSMPADFLQSMPVTIIPKSKLSRHIRDFTPDTSLNSFPIHHSSLQSMPVTIIPKSKLSRHILPGKKMQEYCNGGMVKSTGKAKVHAGELVIPKNKVASVKKALKKAGVSPY